MHKNREMRSRGGSTTVQRVVNEILNFPSYLPSFFENKKEKWQYFHT